MPRPTLRFDDATLRALLAAARRADAAYPTDNAACLVAFVREARTVTRRLYGAQAYLRLLAAADVIRRPSTATVQKAIERVRQEETADRPPASVPEDADWPALIEVAVRRAVGPRTDAAMAEASDIGVKTRLQAAEQALADAYRRARRLEQENGELRRQLGRAEGALHEARQGLGQAVAQLHEALTAGHGAAARLDDAATRLVSTEQFLKLQNDAVRQQIEASARQWQQRTQTLEGRVKQQAELIEVLQRTLTSRGS